MNMLNRILALVGLATQSDLASLNSRHEVELRRIREQCQQDIDRERLRVTRTINRCSEIRFDRSALQNCYGIYVSFDTRAIGPAWCSREEREWLGRLVGNQVAMRIATGEFIEDARRMEREVMLNRATHVDWTGKDLPTR